jgi:urea transport system substrate-binding protein
MSEVSRRALIKAGFAVAGTGAATSALSACGPAGGGGGSGPLKIGALIPVTGLETHNGLSMKYGVEMATAEINKAGGLGGRTVKLITKNSASDVARGVQAAQELIKRDQVDALVGTLLSSVRAAVFDVAKKSDTLYMNPTFYEGGLCAPNYFSTGATPNQTIDPLAAWTVKNMGKKIYFIGSDYVWGTGSIKAAVAAVTANGGSVVGKPTFVPLGTTDFSAQIRAIEQAKPDVVWPFVAGQDGITFLKQLTDAGVRQKVGVVADYIDELIVPALSPDVYKGIVNCSTYYMDHGSPANSEFLAKMRKKYGQDALISSFGMNMYNNMKLLEVAAKKAGKWDSAKVRKALVGATFDGPSGPVTFERTSQHATTNAYIAEIDASAGFKVIETVTDVKPQAFCSV